MRVGERNRAGYKGLNTAVHAIYLGTKRNDLSTDGALSTDENDL